MLSPRRLALILRFYDATADDFNFISHPGARSTATNAPLKFQILTIFFRPAEKIKNAIKEERKRLIRAAPIKMGPRFPFRKEGSHSHLPFRAFIGHRRIRAPPSLISFVFLAYTNESPR